MVVIPEQRSLNPTTINYLAAHLNELDSKNLDITQLAIALKNHIIPAIQEHSKTQHIIDEIKNLLSDPVIRPTTAVTEVKSFLNNNNLANSETLEKIKETMDYALHNPPQIRFFFVTFKPRHEDSTLLYKKIYALAAGIEWCEKEKEVKEIKKIEKTDPDALNPV